MTTKISVSVNGNYKVPVRVDYEDRESVVTVVSGRDSDGPRSEDFHMPHGTGAKITVGPESQDHGVADDGEKADA